MPMNISSEDDTLPNLIAAYQRHEQCSSLPRKRSTWVIRPVCEDCALNDDGIATVTSSDDPNLQICNLWHHNKTTEQ